MGYFLSPLRGSSMQLSLQLAAMYSIHYVSDYRDLSLRGLSRSARNTTQPTPNGTGPSRTSDRGQPLYVGASDVSAYLFTTPEGHVLLDTGFRETVPLIQANLKKLGFRMADIRLLLATHAHYDHAGGLAAIKARSKARFLAHPADAPLFAAGGRAISHWGTGIRSRPRRPMDCFATASRCNWAAWR